MKEEDYDILDLLTNEEFKKWVLEPSYERDEYWSKWMEMHPEKIASVNAAKEFIRNSRYESLSLADEKDHILSNIMNSRESVEKLSRPLVRKSYVGWYRAAVIIFMLGVGLSAYWLTNKESLEDIAPMVVKKENPAGRKSNFLLPDGTRVILNAESNLTYNPDYGEIDRTVILKGEAYFEVAHNPEKPFHVISGNIETTALGTAFNVRDYDTEKQIRVALNEGKVKISSISTHNEGLLAPGEGMLIAEGSTELQKIEIDMEEEFGWKDGIIVLKDNDLEEVKERLERWYGVEITIKGKPARPWRVEARFTNVSLEEVLKSLSYTYDLNYTINGKNVELNLK